LNYKAKVYLVGDNDEKLVPLEETGFIQESDLQELLANYPDLLPGDQIDPENPRRWILVSREMGIPSDSYEGDRWSLDHLFLDQDGIPTFVECKRASDTRNRREVVAQMLDYAANGIEYWNVDRLRQATSEASQLQGIPLDEKIIDLLGGDTDLTAIDDYWDIVETNLKERKVRLVFVSDSTPKELRRLVEFLNEEMANIEVLAVEIKSYKGIGANTNQALVPRVIGLTETVRSQKKKIPQIFPTENDLVKGWDPAVQEAYFIFKEQALANLLTYKVKKTQISYQISTQKGKLFLCGFHGSGKEFKIWLRSDTLSSLFDFQKVAGTIKLEIPSDVEIEHTETWFILTFPPKAEYAKFAFELIKNKIMSNVK